MNETNQVLLMVVSMVALAGFVLWWSQHVPTCRHEYTHWEPRSDWPRQWWRVCTKCEKVDVAHSENEPTR